MKVFIDPSCDIQYSSFYIYGLYSVFGKKNVRYSSDYFNQFKHQNHFFAFVIIDGVNTKNVVVDFTDSSTIHAVALQWSNVYGKVNYDPLLSLDKKIIPIGPSFGIQIYSLVETLWFASKNLLRAYNRILNKRKFLSDYKAQFKRPKFSEYYNNPSKPNYIFFMASLWKQESKTNVFRANYITSCMSNPTIEFEGGFAPRVKKDIEGFEDLTSERRVTMSYYLDKLKNSLLVFNTPAVKSCHGWKLAEYLCLGKAIISTPLSRELPVPLEEGIHLLYTDGSEEHITIKIEQIQSNDQLQKALGLEAKLYFDTFLKPKAVIKRLLNV